jgi:hypothetical protein
MMATYIQNIGVAIDEEMKILNARMEKRRLDIETMKIANERDQDRVQALGLVKSQLDTVIDTLKTLPDFEVDFNLNTGSRKDNRVPQRRYVTDVLRHAALGLTHQQILDQVEQRFAVRLNGRSLATFLYQSVREGAYSKDHASRFSIKTELTKDTRGNGEDAHS